MGKSDKRLSLQINDDLEFIAQACMRANKYRSHSENYAAYNRHWALSQQPHSLTAEWAALSPEERDKIDAGLRELVESGEGIQGSWLKAMIYECIQEINGEGAKFPTILQTMDRLPDVIRRGLEKRAAKRKDQSK